MKKTTLIIVCLLVSIISFAQELSNKTATLEFDNSKSALQLVKNYVDGLNSGDVNKMTAQLSDTAIIIGLGGALDSLTVAQHKDYFTNSINNFSHSTSDQILLPVKVTESDMIKGEWVLNWGTNTVTDKKTGTKIAIPYHTVSLVEGGKIVLLQYFYDMANILTSQGYTLTPPNNNSEIVDKLYTAFGKGDIPTVLAGLDDNVVWNEAEGNAYADGNPYVGPQAVLDGIFSRVGADYEYFKLKDIKLHEMSNSQVLATLRYDGKLKKNGAAFDAQVAHLWTLNNGKVIAFQQYVDTKKLADANQQK